MTELTFLVDLLLNHKLPKLTRDAVAARIKEVEAGIGFAPPQRMAPQPAMARPQNLPPHIANQSPSMQAIMLRNPDLIQGPGGTGLVKEYSGDTPPPPTYIIPAPEPQPVAIIAQTPAAVNAMNERAATIRQGMSGKPEKGRTSPRKF